MNASAGEMHRDLAKGLTISRENGLGSYSPSDLFNKSSIHEFIEQVRLCMMGTLLVTCNHISAAVDAARGSSQQMHPHSADLRYLRPGGKNECVTFGFGGRTERVPLQRVEVDQKEGCR